MTEKIYYNVLKEADTEIVNGIVSLYIAGGWWKENSIPEIIPDMVKGSFIFLAAGNKKDKLLGMGRVISDGVSDAYIQDVVVLEEFRGMGIGKKIINTLISICLQSGILWIGLVAEPETEKFYEELGFSTLEGHIPLRYKGN